MYKCAYFGVIDIIIDFLLHAANEKMIKKISNFMVFSLFAILLEGNFDSNFIDCGILFYHERTDGPI